MNWEAIRKLVYNYVNSFNESMLLKVLLPQVIFLFLGFLITYLLNNKTKKLLNYLLLKIKFIKK